MFGNVAVACEPPNRVDLISLHRNIRCARRIFSSFQFLISFVYMVMRAFNHNILIYLLIGKRRCTIIKPEKLDRE